MNEEKMRQIAKQVYAESQSIDRIASMNTSSHNHNGIDSPRISQANIVPGIRASGSITFAQSTLYTLGLTFNPTSILFYGIAVNNNASSPTIRAHCVGNAQLGASFYFQPLSATSVTIGGPTQEMIQSSTTFLVDSSTSPVTVRATVDEGHLVDVEYGGILARATIVSVGGGSIVIDVSVASTWQIIGNYVVT